MSGHGVEPALISVLNQQERDDAGRDDEEPRDGARQEEVENVAAAAVDPSPAPSIVTQLKNPKMKKPMAPPIFIQSDVLNLLRSTCASR